MTKLEETARELGFQIKKGSRRGSGYVLKNTCHDDVDEFPLGVASRGMCRYGRFSIGHLPSARRHSSLGKA